MFEFYVKKITITILSLAIVLIPYLKASAQLNIGRYGVQSGLEQLYLQYQLSGQDLSKMESIPECTVGFGLGCNKFATILEQLLESHQGYSYYNLLIQAAGGEKNFHNFASFYGNNPNLLLIPYASFWKNDDPHIMDSYQYLLGSSVNPIPVQGLGRVTKNFYWSPLKNSDNSLSLRHGLLNLKYSYGRLLFEEVAKIPNFQQQIQALELPKNIKQFYLNNVSQGLHALKSQDEILLRESILNTLSLPFSTQSQELGRSNIGIPKDLSEFIGASLPGDAFVGAVSEIPTPDTISQAIPSGFSIQQEGSSKFPGWLVGGAGLATLLLILSLSGNGSSNGGTNATVSVVPPLGAESNPTPSGGTFPSVDNPIIEVLPTPPVVPGAGEQISKIPEPCVVNSLLLLMIVVCLLTAYSKKHYKKRQPITDTFVMES